jgi:hypothetical protein
MQNRPAGAGEFHARTTMFRQTKTSPWSPLHRGCETSLGFPGAETSTIRKPS